MGRINIPSIGKLSHFISKELNCVRMFYIGTQFLCGTIIGIYVTELHPFLI